MPDPHPPVSPRFGRAVPWPWILGLLAGLAVLLTIGDPGITSDEPIDVKVGRDYVSKAGGLIDQVSARGIGSIRRADLDAFFADNAQHPPLGRWLVGLASVAFEPIEGLLGGADPISVRPARVAPMFAFALLVGLIAAEAGRRYGEAAGIVAGISLVFMPRAFAHAHFATLDTVLAFFWTLALLSSARAIESRRPTLGLAVAGIAWGLALLTKIHAWLLPPLVIGYALARLPIRKAVAGSVAWGVVGLIVFVVGWPWLWNDSADRLVRFLSTSVDRQPLRVLYFGSVVDDVALPWHYPWAYFALTVPVGLHLLGFVGAGRGLKGMRADPFPALLVASILLFLVLFATRAPVDDGERLFLHVFPGWAILVGLGFRTLWDRIGPRRWARGALVALVVMQGAGVLRMHPYQLSYYNLLVGGLPGADRLGLELTYWGDSLSPGLIAEVERVADEGDTVVLAPSLHHIHPTALLTPGLFEKGVTIRPQEAIDEARWLLVFRREAYWHPRIEAAVRDGRVVAEASKSGVWLARLIELRSPIGLRDRPPFAPDNREDSFRTN
jgi:hypothetical protein